uniref:Uncharacterized protein n=1 Tax=viral metagenome TaxID=1070528 RepID=A0A6M3JQQ1_9ZZZZ
MKVCPKCGEKKPRTTEYWSNDKSRVDGFCGHCKLCRNSMHKVYCSNNPEKIAELTKQWILNNPKTPSTYARERQWARADRERLSDRYVRIKLTRCNIPVTPEMIELKRQQIIMKRTLKLFKKWRFENESDSTNVQGKQCEDEKDYVRAVQR